MGITEEGTSMSNENKNKAKLPDIIKVVWPISLEEEERNYGW
jgi:hypothetical protein